MSKGLVGPGVMEGCRQVHSTVVNYQQRPLEPGNNENSFFYKKWK